MKIRVVKTASKAKAVQVVRYQNNKRIVVQHIGSAHTSEALKYPPHQHRIKRLDFYQKIVEASF